MKKTKIQIKLLVAFLAITLMNCQAHSHQGDSGDDGDYKRSYDLKDFDAIDVGSIFNVQIKQSDSYSIKVVAERKKDIEDLDIRVRNGELKISFNDHFFEHRDRVNVYITMPNISSLDISGASKMKVHPFTGLNNVDIDISGASNAKIDIEANDLRVDASGASHIEIYGRIDEVDVDISGASHFKAKDATINRASVDASGASHASFGKIEKLSSETSGASHVSRG